uniref:Uncharacterized protein n=1 Tax=Geladintestivirus 2 TaxID=3233134 RepID=A0AAU8MIN2_9CAUD
MVVLFAIVASASRCPSAHLIPLALAVPQVSLQIFVMRSFF